MAPDWAEALAPVDDRIGRMGRFLRDELAAGRRYLPAGDNVLRAFQRPLADVRVLVVGQDPYPTPGHPIGLSFAVETRRLAAPAQPGQHLPASCATTSASMPPRHGDLTGWADQGVMLLNRVLTVRPGESASHRGRGWEEVTERAIAALVERGGPLRRDPVGPRRPVAEAAARPRCRGSSPCTPPRFGEPRLLRLQAVLAGEPRCWTSRARASVDWSLSGNKVES